MSNVSSVSAGGYYTMAIDEDGSLWGWGWNSYGQVGTGDTEDVTTPVEIEVDGVAFTSVSAGITHTLAVTEDNELYAWGDNSNGQLGDGTVDSSYTPISVRSNVSSAAAGYGYSLFIDVNSKLYAVGNNYYGQLGNGDTTTIISPEKLDFKNVTSIDVSWYISACVTSSGEWYAWGNTGLDSSLITVESEDEGSNVWVVIITIIVVILVLFAVYYLYVRHMQEKKRRERARLRAKKRDKSNQ